MQNETRLEVGRTNYSDTQTISEYLDYTMHSYWLISFVSLLEEKIEVRL